MNPKTLLLAIPMFALLVTGCKTKPKNEDNIAAKVDSTYAMVADLKMEQLKVLNRFFEDSKYTSAIQEYSNAKSVAEKIRIADAAKVWPDDLPAPNEFRQKVRQGIDFVSYRDGIKPEEFDLALRNNDAVAEQVKLMNRYFQGLDKPTLDAIDYYENLSREDKLKLFSNEAALTPVPDYVKAWVNREFQYTYNLQQLLLYYRLQRYLQTRRFINEFPQGFKQQQQSLSSLQDEKKFDLNLVSKSK
jgi:hypothetical protein